MPGRPKLRRAECLRDSWLRGTYTLPGGHVCGYVIASSNQMPVFNATHKQMNKRTDWKRLNTLRRNGYCMCCSPPCPKYYSKTLSRGPNGCTVTDKFAVDHLTACSGSPQLCLVVPTSSLGISPKMQGSYNLLPESNNPFMGISTKAMRWLLI